jgi:cytochrome c553
MKAHWLFVAAIAVALGAAGPSYAGDVAAGKAKSKSCAGCHGADGKGKKDNPAIAGQPEAQFIKAMGEYKSGAREHKMMKKFAGKLSDEDIANLAAYYASLK